MTLRIVTPLALLHFFCAAIGMANENPIKRSFQYSIVEVLTDRMKDDQAELNHPIPFQKIPFRERTDKYQSIGTAWFVNDKELFSAAHVFSAKLASFTNNFYVRTVTGDVYAIDQVTLYSNQFDIISFTLKGYPQNRVAIPIAKTYSIGDDVCVPGNALGLGVSLRCGGQISSLAQEPKNGQWKEIYFSTPVSPGNSGSPLIDSSGRALGIVTRKIPGEDLNIAMPFNELKKQASKLEYFEKDVGFQNNVVQPLVANGDLLIGSNQPMPVMDWMRLLIAGTNEHLMKMGKAYEVAWYKNGVMNSLPAKAYLKNPKRGMFFTQVKFVNQDLSQVDGDEGDFEKFKRTRRRVTLQKIAKKSIFFIAKNNNEKIEMLMSSAKDLMRSVLSTGKVLQRKIADEDLIYTSLGQPSTSGLVIDLLGRHWVLYSWKLNEIGTSVDLFCTPRPSDVACVFHTHDSMFASDTVASMFRVDMSELTLSYFGSSIEWTEFLAASNPMRPNFMDKITIAKIDGKTRIQAEELSIVAPCIPTAADSIVMNYSSDWINPMRQTPYSVSYFPNIAEKLAVTAVKYYKNSKGPDEVKPADSVYKTKNGRFMAAKWVDQRNANVTVMGYMYGDEVNKLNRVWKSTEFGLAAPRP